MDDTTPEVKELHHSMLMQMSGEERMLIGSMMFDAVREYIVSTLPKGLSRAEIRRRLYERIYGEPLPANFPHPPE